jgi:archaellum biogenesis ATPase FlaH
MLVSCLSVFVLHEESHAINEFFARFKELVKLAKIATFGVQMKVEV